MIPKARPNLGFRELLATANIGAGGRYQFEKTFAAMTGADYGLAFAYVHAGFYALLKALNLTGTEIILPAYTCDIMAEVIVRTNNIPVFVDINLADFNMNLNALKGAITAKTRMIVATHMFGYPADVEAIRQIADNHNVIIVEDAALRLPVAAKQLSGDVSFYSFGPGKPLFTVRGGMCVTNNTQLYEKILDYRDTHMNCLPSKEWIKRWARLLITYFSNTDPGYDLALRLGLADISFERIPNSLDETYATRYADFQARIGLTALNKIDEVSAKRQAIIDFYNQELSGLSGFICAPQIAGATNAYYTARVKNRDSMQFSQKMYQCGIETGRTYDYAVPDFKRYQSYVKSPFLHATQAGQEVVNLPLHVNLNRSKAQFIVNSIRRILQEYS